MRCRLTIWIGAFLFLVHALPAKEPQLDLTQRYLLLSTSRASTMDKELKVAAAAGYRALFSSNGLNQGGLLLEKTEGPGEKHDYLLMNPRGSLVSTVVRNLQKDLNEAASQGYRVVPRTLLWNGRSPVTERLGNPGSLPPTEYLVFYERASSNLEEVMCKASEEGYRFVDIMTNTVIMERTAGPTSEPAASAKGAPNAGCRYRVVGAQRVKTMQKELNEAAAAGCRVVAGSPGSGTRFSLEMVVVMENLGPGRNGSQYEIFQAVRTGEFREDIQQAAARGFHAVSRTLFWDGLNNVLVLEKGPDPGSHYEYLLLSTKKQSTLLMEILQGVEQGYRPIGLTVNNVVLLERSR